MLNWGQALKTLDLRIHILPENSSIPFFRRNYFPPQGRFEGFNMLFLDLNMLNPMSFNAWKLEMNPRRAGKTGFFPFFFFSQYFQVMKTRS